VKPFPKWGNITLPGTSLIIPPGGRYIILYRALFKPRNFKPIYTPLKIPEPPGFPKERLKSSPKIYPTLKPYSPNRRDPPISKRFFGKPLKLLFQKKFKTTLSYQSPIPLFQVISLDKNTWKSITGKTYFNHSTVLILMCFHHF